MATTTEPEISKKWWKTEKPADIKGVDLDKALTAAEKALADVGKKENADTIKAALGALSALSTAIDKTIKKECDKKKHKNLIEALGNLDDLVGDEIKDCDKAQEAEKEDDNTEEEDDEKGVFKEEYRDRMIKQLRSGTELSFAFGLNKQDPAQSRIVLCIKRKPERLFRILKQTGDFSNRLLTFGRASGDGKILQFNLAEDAKEPSQIAKLAKEYLKSDKSLKFRKLRVVSGGQNFEEDVPDEEVQGAAQASSAAPGASMEDLRKQFKIARKKWVVVRETAEQDLEIVKDGVRNHYINDVEQFPIAVNKLIELDQIMENLNHDLRDALDAYVSTPLNQQAKLHELGDNARQIVTNFADYVDRSPLLTAIDQKEFADVQIKAPMSAALKELAKTIA